MDRESQVDRGLVDVEPRLDVRELRYFLGVAEELNFTRAADRLHVAQQALSAAIREIELSLGVQLFVRSTRHVALTSAGELLVPHARRILGAVAGAVHELDEAAAGRRGRLVIGVAIAVHGLPVVRDAIRRFTEETPGVEVQVVGHDHGDPTAGLQGGSSHVAFVLAPLTVDGCDTLTVLEEPRHALLPANHPLAAREDLRARDLAGLPWLRVPGPSTSWTKTWFEHPLGEASSGPEVRSGVDWVPAIQAGRAVGYSLPSLAAGYLPADVVTRRVTDVEPGSVVLAWRADPPDPLVAAFVAVVRQVLAAT